MRHSVDWISFTVEVTAVPPGTPPGVAEERMARAVGDLSPALADALAIEPVIERVGGRNPYSNGMRFTASNVVLFWGFNQKHCLVEISGKGCAYLRRFFQMKNILRDVADRVTRIDIATDILTTLTPREFVEAGYSDRIKSRASADTPTGLTEYVGSQTSDKFARVYRYLPPHPRNELLRVEHVLRRSYAKAIVATLLEHGNAVAAATVGKRMGWQHPWWSPEVSADDGFALPKEVQSDAKTVRWLTTQVATAFRRLVQEGVIDNPGEFLHEHFLKPFEESEL